MDYIYRLPQLPERDGKIEITSRRVTPGGQVATAMCACAALGLRAKYIGAFGADANGTRIRDELDRRGVDTRDAPRREAPNRSAVILVDEPTGDRVVLWQRDPRLALTAGDIRAETITGARVLHVDAVDGEAAIAAARFARTSNIRVTSDVDRVTDRTPDLLDAVDVAVVAAGVPEALTGEADLARALRALASRHHVWVCVTLGARGAMLFDGERLHDAPAFRVGAIDTTGAGDVFRAGLIYALLRGAAPGEMLTFANAAAAVSCTRHGAIDSVPTLAEVEALIAAKTV